MQEGRGVGGQRLQRDRLNIGEDNEQKGKLEPGTALRRNINNHTQTFLFLRSHSPYTQTGFADNPSDGMHTHSQPYTFIHTHIHMALGTQTHTHTHRLSPQTHFIYSTQGRPPTPCLPPLVGSGRVFFWNAERCKFSSICEYQ